MSVVSCVDYFVVWVVLLQGETLDVQIFSSSRSSRRLSNVDDYYDYELFLVVAVVVVHVRITRADRRKPDRKARNGQKGAKRTERRKPDQKAQNGLKRRKPDQKAQNGLKRRKPDRKARNVRFVRIL